ncbi:CATRA conflict system CASPASE/TPR repeat-associated protein [Catenuloplanes atrovinosus]|uniref:Uncharacterized protein n=1 Tax=Catenuloplanes atrovinosus TaxID=137266 RepID=A0AAE3YL08_9ACTN|nr:CATRA conflict system CASPASE/TPR repeat-associated protein [Catenuloplanes atrovinosus]MDR7275405.1 hypothetical protein [Catenuloplanes atrovinosus]
MELRDQSLYEYALGLPAPNAPEVGRMLAAARTPAFGMHGSDAVGLGGTRLSGGSPPGRFEVQVRPGNPTAVLVRLLPRPEEIGWPSLVEAWDRALGAPSGERAPTGRARVYVAEYVPTAHAHPAAWRAAAEKALPASIRGTATEIVELATGVLFWEVTPESGRPEHRHLVLLVSVDQRETVDRWLWPHDGTLPMLAGVLWAVAQIRAQDRRWNALRPGVTRRAVRDAATDVLIALEPPAPDSAVDEVAENLQRRGVRLALVHAETRDIAATVTSARTDAEAILRGWPHECLERGPFTADLRAARRLERETADELPRARAALDMIEPLDRLTAGRVERRLHELTDRTEQLVLLQTTVLGALVVVLTAIQSLGYTWPLSPSLRLPVIVTLGWAAVLLPAYVGRLPTASAPRRRIPGWLSVPIAGLAASLVWLALTAGWQIAASTPAPPRWTLPLTGAAAAAGLATALRWRGRAGEHE